MRNRFQLTSTHQMERCTIERRRLPSSHRQRTTRAANRSPRMALPKHRRTPHAGSINLLWLAFTAQWYKNVNSHHRMADRTLNNDPLRHSKAELRSALRAIEGMKEAETMEDFEEEWKQYLTCLEKVWAKVERTCKPQQNTFQPWQGKFQALRKKDMLLRYLKQARDADNHSIQDLTAIKPGQMTINFPSGSGRIDHLYIDNSRVVSYSGDPMIETVTPPHPIAVPIRNNGVWYNPPTSHLGNNVPNLHPITIAELGIEFYSNYLEEVENKFFREQQ